MPVTATVTHAVEIHTLHQAATLAIDTQDIQRGYLVIPAGSRIRIAYGNGCLLEFRGTGEVFRSVVVTTPGGRATEFRQEGGSLYRAAAPAENVIVLDYRIYLAADARPGVYAWPLSLTVLPM